jgi:hypothetical protein
MSNYQKFRTLDSISRTLRFFGIFVGILAVVGFVFALFEGTGFTVAFSGLIGSAVLALLIVAFGELLQCFLAIEQNTRRTLEAVQAKSTTPPVNPEPTDSP